MQKSLTSLACLSREKRFRVEEALFMFLRMISEDDGNTASISVFWYACIYFLLLDLHYDNISLLDKITSETCFFSKISNPTRQ